MKHLKLYEFFGWSKSEKEEKQAIQDIESLKKEVLNYNWLRLAAQPSKDYKDAKYLVELRLQSAKEELTILYKMLPQLWDDKINTRAIVKYGEKTIQMILPNGFHFIIDNEGEINNSDKNKQRILQWILNKIKTK